MDKPTYVNGPEADAGSVADFRDAAASDLDSVRAFAAEGCVSGLIPDLAASTVGVGEVIVGGNRARAREAVSIDLAGVTRPASGEYRWVAITAAYATATVRRHPHRTAKRHAARSRGTGFNHSGAGRGRRNNFSGEQRRRGAPDCPRWARRTSVTFCSTTATAISRA